MPGEEITYNELRIEAEESYWETMGHETLLSESEEKERFERWVEDWIKGWHIGCRRSIEKIVRNMKAHGLPNELIAKYSSLSPEEILRLC